METPALGRLRAELLAVLAAHAEPLRNALREKLAQPLAVEPGRRIKFEIDDFQFGVTLCATEETILSGGWLDVALPKDWFERADEVAGGWSEMIASEVCPWFADCWQAAGGPSNFSPAYLFFHLRPQEVYDLERRCQAPFSE